MERNTGVPAGRGSCHILHVRILYIAGITEGEHKKTAGAEGSHGSDVHFDTSLSDQEKSCIDMLRNGLLDHSKGAAEAPVGVTLHQGSQAAQQHRNRTARIRDKNRRAQQKYRERKKVQLAGMKEDLENRKRQLTFLRAANQRLVGIGHALSYSCSLRMVLSKRNMIRFSDDAIRERADFNDENSMSIKRAREVVQGIQDAKRSLRARQAIDMKVFKERIIDPFWKLSSEDPAAFVQQIVCGTGMEDGGEEAKESFKEFVLSILKENPLSDLTGTTPALDRVADDFEKLLFRAQYIAAMVFDSPGDGLKSSPLLLGLSRISGSYLKEYVCLYESLQNAFSPEQFARIWLESPTIAIPDAFQILHWMNDRIYAQGAK